MYTDDVSYLTSDTSVSSQLSIKKLTEPYMTLESLEGNEKMFSRLEEILLYVSFGCAIQY